MKDKRNFHLNLIEMSAQLIDMHVKKGADGITDLDLEEIAHLTNRIRAHVRILKDEMVPTCAEFYTTTHYAEFMRNLCPNEYAAPDRELCKQSKCIECWRRKVDFKYMEEKNHE